ncbi:MAG: MoxR family ATPase, partial [Acidobacteriota bacterium]
LLIALLAQGHVLMEGPPGTAKTLLARTFSRCLGLSFARIQFTPDLMPGDVVGTSLFDFSTSQFSLTKGPIFTDFLLADEINRTPPKTQSALLQAMQERQVTIDGETHDLPSEFLVVATQNPIEHEGTYPLPEAQLDRFLMRLEIGYPSLDAEVEMLARGEREDPFETVQQALSLDVLSTLRRRVRHVHVHPEVRKYVAQLVAATRTSKDFALGCGPRATKGLYRAAQAAAAMSGRDFVTPDDIKRLVPSVLYHRVILGPEGRLSQRTVKQAVDQAIALVPAPILDASAARSDAP